MTRTRREYSQEEKATAVGLALTIGPVRAGRQLGIPPRNVSNWQRDPAMVVLQQQTRDQLAARLWDAVTVGVDAVLKGLQDPDARLSDKARALEVVAQQHALLTGGVTDRTETVDSDPYSSGPLVRREEVRAELIEMMETIENATDEELAEHEQKATQMLSVAERVVRYVPEPES